MSTMSSPKGESMAELLKKKELTVSEVQKITGLSRATIYNMMKRGELEQGGSLTLVYGKRIKTESVRKFLVATHREIPKI